jgi:hypothetical protein
MRYGFQTCDIPNVKHMSLKLRLQNFPTLSFVFTSQSRGICFSLLGAPYSYYLQDI